MAKARCRKKIEQARGFETEESKRLRVISKRINAGDIPGALDQINSELGSEQLPARKGKLLGQVARTLYKRGRFSEASETFAKASELATSHPREWFPPETAKIKSLFKQVAIPQAVEAAHACYARAEAKLAEFEDQRSGAAEELRQKGSFTVPVKPHRLSVVASEIGDLFFLEGELETAKIFFDKAVQNNPRGGTRARQGLAEIALRMDDPETAFQRSVEALTLGKFQSKTIASWKPFFAAKRKLGQQGLPAEFVASIKACRPSVRARTTLAIIRELRAANDPQWKELSANWQSTESKRFPAVAAELRKMEMSETKRSLANPDQQVATARALLSTDKLAPHEWLAGAKEVVRASLFAGANPGIDQLVAESRKKFGSDFSPQLQHSLALSCMMAKRHDLARPILRAAIGATAGAKNHIWSKSVWALGRMEALLKNYKAAVSAFGDIAIASEVPAQFRLQARMLWAENLLKTGDTKAIAGCIESIPAMLQGVQDYELLLNFARQLSRSEPEFRKTADKVYKLGESASLQAFATASHPSQAIEILFKLTRRQLYDFHGSDAIIQFWKSMPDQKRLWLWNNNNYWWGYQAFVLQAFLRTNNLPSARELAGTILNDPSTPRTALPAILIPYYDELIYKGSPAESLEAFEWIVTENPTKAGCARAYYWLALDAYRRSATDETKKYLTLMQTSNAHTEVNLDKWMLSAKGLLLEANLDAGKVSKQAVDFVSAFFNKAKIEIQADLKYLGS